MKHYVSIFSLLLFCELLTTEDSTGVESINETLLKEQKFYQKPITREYLTLARRYQTDGHYDQALDCYKKVLEQNEHNFNALMNIAEIYFIEKDFSHAIDYYERIINLFPRSVGAYYNLGLCYLNEKKYKQAQDAFETALKSNQKHSKAWFSLGVAAESQHLYDKALEAYTKASEYDNSFIYALLKIGQLYRYSHQWEKSLSYLEQAYTKDSKNIHIIMELANTLNSMDKHERALELYMKALEIDPLHVPALYNFGFTLKKKDLVYEAIQVYKKVIELDPHYPLAHFSLGTALLTIGEFEQGWKEYEWRFAAYQEPQRQKTIPLWDGTQSLSGKKIVVYAEQGLGDTIQFSRYVPTLIQHGASVIFQVQRPLKKLFQVAGNFGTIIDSAETITHADYYVPLMSLPYLLKTTIDSIPAATSYLAADPHLMAYWKSYLAHDDNLRIGICWHGNTRYQSYTLQKLIEKKAIPMHLIAQLADIPGVSLYSLQKLDSCDNASALAATAIKTFGPDFDIINGPFMDSAAVIKNLDLVISVDTAIAHLAAGLGAPTWILLPRPADWRWLMYRSDSPWYPSVRLFRQATVDDWSCVISVLHHALKTKVNEINNQASQPKVETIDTSFSFNEMQYFSLPEILDYSDGTSMHEKSKKHS